MEEENKTYVYPAIFHLEDGGVYSVFLPDFNDSATYGQNLEKALFMATDLLYTLIEYTLNEGKELPEASDISDFKVKSKNDFVDFVQVCPAEYKKALKNSVFDNETEDDDEDDE